MAENPVTHALENIDFDEILPAISEIQLLDTKVDIISFNPPLDSSDMNPEQWGKLARIIYTHYGSYDGFLILHGTDTMAYTASALSFMLEGLNKPVILTGSQLPVGKLRTDGKSNLVTAIEIASAYRADGLPMVPEVGIFFHDKLLRGNRATKSSADYFDAFHSFNYPPLARAAIDIYYDEAYIMPYHPGVLIPHYQMDTHMLVLSVFPGLQQEIVESMLAIPGLKGVVLRTFGSGNAPQQSWFTHSLRKATDKGIVVVNITQCAGGYVAMERYGTGVHLEQAGVVSGRDSTVEAALTKMMRLFGDGLSAGEVRMKMNQCLCGEF